MHKQMELLHHLVSENAAPARRVRETDAVKLTWLSDSDDIEAYLTTFERMMGAYDIAKECWPFKLTPQLTGKAQQAYAALPPDGARDYDEVKAAILRRYNINEETYRQRFRSLKVREGEAPRELVTRLTHLATRWTRECTSKKELLDLMIKEQLLRMLPEDVRIWVNKRKPKNSQEAGELAENYLQARSTTGPKRSQKAEKLPTTKCPKYGLHGHWARDCPLNRPEADAPSAKQPKDLQTRPRYLENVTCFKCNEKGHIAANCSRKSFYCSQGDSEPEGKQASRVCRRGTINRIYCTDTLLDTGSTKTLVRSELVSNKDLLGEETTICCAHGDVVSYPLAAVKMSIGGENVVKAGVSRTLPTSALIGWDVPQLMSLMGENRDSENVLAVMTRSQQRSHRETTPEPDELPTPQMGGENNVSNFDSSLFSPPGHSKPRLTRSQKRANNRTHDGNRTQVLDPQMGVSSDELRTLQEEDKSLQRVRQAADSDSNAATCDRFFRRGGLLYRRYRQQGGDDSDEIEQLVLPTRCRPAVIELVHNVPMAGHLGRHKTLSNASIGQRCSAMSSNIASGARNRHLVVLRRPR